MYQCQMLKQTMGHPAYAFKSRVDDKMYRLVYPQRPLVATRMHDAYGCAAYPSGTNAVICVASYTGYDMEDAMCINKASIDRGYAHG